MSAVTVDLPKATYASSPDHPAFPSTAFDTVAHPGERLVAMLLGADQSYQDVMLDADDARSLAAALLAAADASEVLGR